MLYDRGTESLWVAERDGTPAPSPARSRGGAPPRRRPRAPSPGPTGGRDHPDSRLVVGADRTQAAAGALSAAARRSPPRPGDLQSDIGTAPAGRSRPGATPLDAARCRDVNLLPFHGLTSSPGRRARCRGRPDDSVSAGATQAVQGVRNNDVRSAQVRLFVRRRQGRRQGRDEGPARRQGGQPRRDERHRHPRPPGFTITTEVCAAYYEQRQEAPRGRRPPDRGRRQEDGGPSSAAKFGDPADPLLVSRPLRRRAVDARA